MSDKDTEPSIELNKQEMNKIYREKKISLPHKSQIRNLRQYKDLSNEEFEEKFTKEYLGLEPERQWENRIQIKIKEIGEDYNLDDLKINDKYTLRALAAAVIRLEDWDSVLGKLMLNMDDQVMLKIDKISNIQSSLRGDISKMQDDLKISRKSRRSEKEEDAITFVEDLKVKAKKFYEQKMMYIFCPKCNTLLTTMWFLYPQFKTNVIKLKCHRDLGDGIICDGEVNITSEWLFNNGMRNKRDIPEALR
jgi:hypothetical protein